MIDYQREQQQTIPVDQVKIIGVGGAGANMLDRIALDGADASTMLALNTDQRTLNSAMAGEKVQLGAKLTMGLGSGGDPEIGLGAAQEVETEIRDALRNQKIVFICVGLGGGTGSGAAPLVTRIAREQGAFVVVFATMPFAFEGKRRREQAETSLNELSVLSNALVTFDNGKMGELVLASQGIHEAFAAADVMISQSIKAVTRLVVKPGIINVGLDDLMAALKATKSRCLFGSGLASGENRSQQALKNALTSPLLDKGALLKSATTVLVHISGGEGMSLYEVELLMRELAKHVPEEAHILFGAAVDESMGDSLSVTLISALPESMLLKGSSAADKKAAEDVDAKAPTLLTPGAPSTATTAKKPEPLEAPKVEEKKVELPKKSEAPKVESKKDTSADLLTGASPKKGAVESSSGIVSAASTQKGKVVLESITKGNKSDAASVVSASKAAEQMVQSKAAPKVVAAKASSEASIPPKAPNVKVDKATEVLSKPTELPKEKTETFHQPVHVQEVHSKPPVEEKKKLETEIVKLAPKGSQTESGKPQAELALDGGPKGKFSGEAPNVVDGEDLDIPPFLRNK